MLCIAACTHNVRPGFEGLGFNRLARLGKPGMINKDKRRLVLDKAAFVKSVHKNASMCLVFQYDIEGVNDAWNKAK